MMKKTEIEKNGNLYQVTAIYDTMAMVEVTVYRIRRPNWKIFRRELFSIGSKNFFVVDFPTIESGVNWAVNEIFKRNGIVEETSQKLKDYFG